MYKIFQGQYLELDASLGYLYDKPTGRNSPLDVGYIIDLFLLTLKLETP